MTTVAAWTTDRQQDLQEQLVGFWAQDEWRARDCPHQGLQAQRGVFRFTCTSSAIKIELKYACWQKFLTGAWSQASWRRDGYFHRIVAWLNHTHSQSSTLMEHDISYWQTSLRSYLAEKGLFAPRTRSVLHSSQGIVEYPKSDPTLCMLRQLYLTIEEVFDDRDEYAKDIWDFRKLGLRINLSKSDYKLNFTKIAQPWLQQASKQFLRYCLATGATETSRTRLAALNLFSQFLRLHFPSLQPSTIERRTILEYLSYLHQLPLRPTTRTHYLAYLKEFLELCARENWAEIPDKRLIYHEDYPQLEKHQPRFIPQGILDQLNQVLETFPPQTMRMILVVQEVGMRVSELCQMPFDCLVQDTAGDWFLRWYQSKMYKEHSVPVSRELVAVIQEQQAHVKVEWGRDVLWLFPNVKGQAYRQRWFVVELNQMAFEKQICDASGKIFRFQSHQFRHSVATKMINSGVPQHIVQRYLGHESARMTATYAFIHDQTLKEEYMRFRGKTIDVTGQIVEPKGRANTSDLQWVKKNILAQALPNGSCALPVLAGTCPHANACLTCVHFRTDASFLPQHKAQLEETQQLIQVARANGWQRQMEMNEKVTTNLENIIASLEETDHDA